MLNRRNSEVVVAEPITQDDTKYSRSGKKEKCFRLSFKATAEWVFVSLFGEFQHEKKCRHGKGVDQKHFALIQSKTTRRQKVMGISSKCQYIRDNNFFFLSAREVLPKALRITCQNFRDNKRGGGLREHWISRRYLESMLWLCELLKIRLILSNIGAFLQNGLIFCFCFFTQQII